MASAASRFFESYDLCELIGKGTFSALHRCVHRKTGQQFTVKITEVHRYTSFKPNVYEELKTEVSIWKSLKHAYIQDFADAFFELDAASTPYGANGSPSTMCFQLAEHLDGADLYSEIVRRATSGFVYSEAVAAYYSRQLLDAVRYLHDRGVAHHALRPHALVLGNRSNSAPLKLTALTSTTMLSNTTYPSPPSPHTDNDPHVIFKDDQFGRCGVADYDAPELLCGGAYTSATDVWYAGVIVFTLLGGALPFSGSGSLLAHQIVNGIISWRTSVWRCVSDEARALIERMTDIEPGQRVTIDEALQHSWIRDKQRVAKMHLPDTVDQLLRFNAKRKFKELVYAATLSSRWDPTFITAKASANANANGNGNGETNGQPDELAPLQAVATIMNSLDQLHFLGDATLEQRDLLLRALDDSQLKSLLTLYDRISVRSFANVGTSLQPDAVQRAKEVFEYLEFSPEIAAVCSRKDEDANAVEMPSDAAVAINELKQLLLVPHIRALLECHDVVAHEVYGDPARVRHCLLAPFLACNALPSVPSLGGANNSAHSGSNSNSNSVSVDPLPPPPAGFVSLAYSVSPPPPHTAQSLSLAYAPPLYSVNSGTTTPRPVSITNHPLATYAGQHVSTSSALSLGDSTSQTLKSNGAPPAHAPLTLVQGAATPRPAPYSASLPRAHMHSEANGGGLSAATSTTQLGPGTNNVQNANATPAPGTIRMRTVQFERRSDEPLGITLKLNEAGRCVVARILHGGFMYRLGLLHTGDEIREINGAGVLNKTAEQLQRSLREARGTVSLKIVPSYRNTPVQCEIYLRALFDYDPSLDELIPCKQAGIPFRVNSVLQVLSKDDHNWWQARLFGSVTGGPDANGNANANGNGAADAAGLVPSPELQEWRATCHAIERSREEEASAHCAWLTRKRSTPKLPTAMPHTAAQAKGFTNKYNTVYDQLELLTYEEVIRLPAFQRKTLVLLGAHGVGRRHIKNTLITQYPDKFAYPIPHTTRPRRKDEINGVHYYFVAEDEMLQDIANNEYLEYGTHEGAMYGTKLDTIKDIHRKGFVAILDVEPQALKILRTAEYAPFIVFIAAPPLKQMIEMHGVNDGSLERLARESEMLEKAYVHYFDLRIVNNDIDETIRQLKQAMDDLATKPQWVPVTWVY